MSQQHDKSSGKTPYNSNNAKQQQAASNSNNENGFHQMSVLALESLHKQVMVYTK